ncbi:MFS transporter [Streptomyces sp. ISL-10]|uniref:MFS transporter n=1 Tax=Streptomyces sp. ISL-10 TaxID=2819172 RepID=UPI001BE6C43E|nr:MFS transporter [Streptomyces sp. ISL-10]MBT2364779.1 MFS transporter [Streptomyces sp. ISL-10]
MTLDPRSARRRFTAVTFLFWLPVGLYIPSQVLLLTERGMGLAVVAGLFAVHSLTVSALELPTGGLSDVVGRRPVLAAAGVLNLAALTALALGTTVWALVAAMFLMGAGRALSSGPAEAWYVDTVQAHSGPDAELRTGLARAGTASAAALAAGTLLGGALPLLLGLGPDPGARLREATAGLVLPLSVPALLGTAVGVGYTAYVLTALPEPPRPRTTLRAVLRGVPATVLGGLRLGTGDALIRRVLLTAGAAGAGLATVELLTPGRAADLTGASESGAVLFAALACTGFVCTAIGSHISPSAARLTGSGEHAVLASIGVSAAGLMLLGTAASDGPAALALAALGYGLVYLGLGAAGPNENDLLHRRVDGTVRATALSVQSLALQSVGALAGVLAGALPSGPPPWLVGAAAVGAAALLWVRRSEPGGPLPGACLPATEAAAGR